MENLLSFGGGRPPLLLLNSGSGHNYLYSPPAQSRTHRSCPDDLHRQLAPRRRPSRAPAWLEVTGPRRCRASLVPASQTQQVEVAKPDVGSLSAEFQIPVYHLSARCQDQAATIAGGIGDAGKGDRESFACDFHGKESRIPSQQKPYPATRRRLCLCAVSSRYGPVRATVASIPIPAISRKYLFTPPASSMAQPV